MPHLGVPAEPLLLHTYRTRRQPVEGVWSDT
jgi:hypothetical protein